MQEKEHDEGHTCGKLEEDGLRQSEMERTGAISLWDVGQSEGMCTLQCVHICVRLQLGYTGKTVCQLSIAILAMVFSSQAFSTHNLTKNRCHLTEDQNSVSVTYTPGTDGLCCLLMISEHISDLFCKSEIRQPSS